MVPLPNYEYAPETCAQFLMRLAESLVRAEQAMTAFQWSEASMHTIDAARYADKLGEAALHQKITAFHHQCFADKDINHDAAIRGVRMLTRAAYECARESDTRYAPSPQ
jgi:hypothetical protein